MKAYEGPWATWQAASAATYRYALIRWAPEKYKRVHALTDADLGYGLAA
ncbi:hypothetical protein [Streptomyces sp. AC555_RSS877]|nr:hypothetical protein [Streptomyces sp. AC555_RSS877]